MRWVTRGMQSLGTTPNTADVYWLQTHSPSGSQPQEADSAFVVSYQRQRLQDRGIIRAILTGRPQPVGQHEPCGRLQHHGILPVGSSAPRPIAHNGYPTGPMAVAISGEPAPSYPQFSMGLASEPHSSSAAIFPHAQPEPSAPATQDGGWLHTPTETSAARNSVGNSLFVYGFD
ncbi:uncharacterized protein EI90DRAFT_3030213 [Cantharellus anzutake]|uniref:uncharacterized protein n=1 Tax=Cantharellus anzutake TaxID=1750568 RepID=UPI00190674A7|nr:uncharacterized protein EI90DRAFT_3030213 [Cantharellus anzutake]KAF8342785.1 hypothetical protein EI90DRAFT_3030213 [Cantharellus anzutake]